jgi:hypothetical protein
MIVYAGRETKIMQNSLFQKKKLSRLERGSDKLLRAAAVLVLGLALVHMIPAAQASHFE